jgi:uncharacterized protein
MWLRIARLISVAIVVIAAGGCSTTPARFYTLDSTATPDGAPAAHISVAVGPISVPASVNQPQFVVQVASNRVELDEFNRWAAPLNDSIARAVAGDLVVLLGTPDVETSPMANFSPAYSVAINVQRFESTRNQGALLDAVRAVYQTTGERCAPAARSRRRLRRAIATMRLPPRTAVRSPG